MLNVVSPTARNRFLGSKLVLMMLVLGIAPFLGADQPKLAGKPTKPAPWHVKNAELRAGVKVDVTAALLRMPPQVYLADLKPLEITGGLAFDPQIKGAIARDLRTPEEKAATIAKQKELYKKEKREWDPKAYNRLGEDKGRLNCSGWRGDQTVRDGLFGMLSVVSGVVFGIPQPAAKKKALQTSMFTGPIRVGATGFEPATS